MTTDIVMTPILPELTWQRASPPNTRCRRIHPATPSQETSMDISNYSSIGHLWERDTYGGQKTPGKNYYKNKGRAAFQEPLPAIHSPPPVKEKEEPAAKVDPGIKESGKQKNWGSDSDTD